MFRMRMGILGVIVTVMLCGIALVATAQDAKEKENSLCVPLGTIVLEPPKSVDSSKNPVEFPHSRHFVYNCKACHHTWNQDARLQTCTTSNCHDLVKAPEKAVGSVPGVKYFKKAYHQKCIGCHREIKKQNAEKEKNLRFTDKTLSLKKTGPTGCVQCHPKD